MNRILFLLVVFFLNCYSITEAKCQNQSIVDSLLGKLPYAKTEKAKATIYSKVAEQFYINVPDSALKYCYKGMSCSERINDISDMAYFHTFIGVLFKNITLYDSAIYHFNKSIELNKKDDFEKGVAGSLNNLGQVYRLKGEYDKALNSYYSSLEIFEKFKDTLNIGELHSNIGALLVKIQEYDAAEEHFKISRKQYKLAGVKLQEAWILYDLGNLKMKTGKMDSAEVYILESSKVWKKFNNVRGYNNCMLRLGEIKMDKKQYDKAAEIFNKAIREFEEVNNLQGVSEGLMLLGRVQFLQKKYVSAIENLKKSLDISDFVQSNQLQMDVYLDLSKCYKELNQFDLAFGYMEKFLLLKDSVFSQNKSKLIAEYQTKLNLLNKEVEIQQLEDSTQRQALKNDFILKENSQKQKSIYLLIVSILFVLIMLFLLFKRNKTNIKLNKELNVALKEREVLIREVHHRVKNNLQIISSLLNLQSEHVETANPVDMLKVSQSRIEAMSMIHENLYKSSQLSEINFREYVENLCRYIDTSFSLSEKGIHLEHEIDPVHVDLDKMVPCGLIINELITNSVKHAFHDQPDKVIQIKCTALKGNVRIEISDNGSGLPSGFDIKQSKSLGLRLANGLVKQLNSKLLLENDKGMRAVFEFKTIENDSGNR
ncbi:MAG: hypothetical protein CVU05_15225 [Bacteroidetes bacterium HGW-Bacteroidetes-21]|jgi:two-component sensor histidine kinase|nr:MAG: hypothetical protein CVU05_15225 [Bacteroidetes bacterium HGW-Bacteroidetes-21]